MQSNLTVCLFVCFHEKPENGDEIFLSISTCGFD